ncbi:RING-H2 finger protein ATL70-like [Prosopis cineraria]|uniref:RING-H2 finger protein ATL70-like n=1 Tax=Prosopis cineraria TaxID=364024 RepID=UPI00240F3875|nr:RING-H2 finger protein ATL70-like [Prosopis cineraria]
MRFSFVFGVIFFLLTLLLACDRLRRYWFCSNSLAVGEESSSDGVVDGTDHESTLQRNSRPLFYSEAKKISFFNPFSSASSSCSSCCSICFMDYKETDKLRLLPNCGHLYHLHCVDSWLKLNPTCPLCRTSSSVVSRRDTVIISVA